MPITTQTLNQPYTLVNRLVEGDIIVEQVEKKFAELSEKKEAEKSSDEESKAYIMSLLQDNKEEEKSDPKSPVVLSVEKDSTKKKILKNIIKRA